MPFFNVLAGVMGGGGGGTPIGGLSVGTIGSGVYSGFTFVDGDDFTALDLVSPANPNGAYFTTRGSYSGGGNQRTPASGALAPNVYVDPAYTGNADANRGVPIPWDGLGGVAPHTIISGEGTGAIRLLSGRQSTAEKALLNAGINPERTAMIASIGRITFQAPCVIEARLRYPTGPAGWHPAFWNYTSKYNQGTTGNEYGFEGNSTVFNAYMNDHTAGNTPNTGTLQIAGGHDGAWHTMTVVMQLTYWSFLIDGVEVNRIGPGVNFSGSNASSGTWSPQNHALPDFFMLTNPAYNSTFLTETYSASAWLAATSGVATDCEWWRIWKNTSATHYTSQAASSLADQQFVAGQAFSVTLPSQTVLWGATGLTENVTGLQSEVEEPGSDAVTGFSPTTGLPTWASYNSGTRVLSGTMPANSGRTHFKVEVTGAGNTCKPYRFRFDVAPVFVGSTSVPLTNGSSSSYDLYAAWDCGRLIGIAGGTSGKGLTATSIPTGMTLGANGIISGTPTVNGPFTVATSCTNSVGQTTSQNITMTVSAASSAVAAPTLVAGTLVGSWDFNDPTKVSTTSGKVTQITVSDGISAATLLNGASTGPVIASDTDGNGTTRSVAQFVSTASAYLQVNSNLGIGTSNACTIVVIAKATHAGGNIGGLAMSFTDIANGGAAFGTSRHVLLGSTGTTGFNYRKIDSGAVSSTAQQGIAYSTTGVHCLVARSPSGATVAPLLNIGTGVNLVGGSANGQATGMTHVTVGATRVTNAQANFLDGNVFRVLIYSNSLSDADQATVLSWAQTNYGVVAA